MSCSKSGKERRIFPFQTGRSQFFLGADECQGPLQITGASREMVKHKRM